ncbi:aldo/keto reductase [Brachyspira aalborgi]|uniref:aldo/keto reductase n=1 Tax=Brachyspira aalborgi TaxID=29522 RepID=UPI0011CC922B|nr:aldo/keto reductase [Brachyspira aalborgi]TXJ16056.1 aldo/keto reductase [Brachyspira aalborgi]TXJ19557.1 aldo/keto reductase [Brachyspira aalborgi]TXJ48864.1 aldo/keto reductase [Brachyspira aalborgi]
MPTAKLNNGVEMPILGFGVYQIPDYDECKRAVLDAFETGYRLIDTAAAYFNEKAVGDAIKESGINRKELFITTKLWINNAGYENAKKGFETSMEKLQLDYLDLYLIHQPFGDYYGSWRAMEELYENKKVRAIGVCNFYPDRLMDLAEHNKIKPAINQIETHPFFQREYDNEIMKNYGTQIESWGPFAEGRGDMFTNPILSEIGKKYNKSAAQVILRWLIQRNVVVIPKSVHKERIIENFNIFDFELSADDMNKIKSMDTGKSLFFSHSDVEIVKFLIGRKV